MKTQLKKLRKMCGYQTQEQFAEKLGVPATRYGAWERGTNEMSLSVAYRITEILGCTLDELVGREAPALNYTDSQQRDLNSCYEKLDEDGEKKLLDYANDLLSTGRYTKSEMSDHPVSRNRTA